MASVKFNRGTIDQAGNNGADALGFLAKGSSGTPTTAGDYGYLYLGTQMVATKYLKDLVVNGDFYTGSTPDQNDLIVSLSYNSGNPIVGAGKRFVTDSVVNPSSGTYSPADTDIMSALAVANYVSAQIGANDTYHGTGDWDSNTWNKYVAKYYKGGVEVTSGDDYHALEFTLPVAQTFTNTDDTHLVTPKAIADYFAGLAGGMRYCGAVSNTTLPTGTGTLAPYKAGDVFIADTAFTIGTGTTVSVEVGDMIVLKGPGTITTLSTTNCDVFERNLDGAVHKASDLTANTVILGAGTDSIKSLANGSDGQMLSMVSSVPAWADYVYQTVEEVSGNANQILVKTVTNGTANAGTTITINDVQHATNADKILQTVSTTNADVPLLIGQNNDSTANPAVTDSTPKDINYSALIKANANTGMITSKDLTVNTKTGSTYGNDTIDVAAALTWQTLS